MKKQLKMGVIALLACAGLVLIASEPSEGVDYDYIYGQWLKCHTHTLIFDEDCNFTGYFSESDTGRRISLEEIEERYNAYK